MARAFVRSSSEYLENTSWAGPTSAPLTLSAWFRTSNTTDGQTILSVHQAGNTGAVNFFRITAGGNVGGDPVQAQAGGSASANTSTGFSSGQWHHACGVFTSSSSRAAFIDGGSKATNSTSATPASIDAVAVGFCDGNTAIDGATMDGDIAEAAIWNVALTDAEVATLANGTSPLLVRPGSLSLYIPLIRDNDKDLIGGLSLTANGTPTVSSHAPVLYPRRTRIVVPATAAPPAGSIPLFMHHYLQMRGA